MRDGNPSRLSSNPLRACWTKASLLLALAFTSPHVQATETSALSLLKKAASALDAGRCEEAERLCLEARSKLPAESPLGPVVDFNLGLARLKCGKTSDAEQLWTDAGRTPDLALQAISAYNLAGIYLQKAQAAIARKETASALDLLNRALDRYRHALRAAPDDPDAKINYEIALRLREQLVHEIQQSKQTTGTCHQGKGQDQKPQASQDQAGHRSAEHETRPSRKQHPSPTEKVQTQSQPQTGQGEKRRPPAGHAALRKALSNASARAILDAIRDDEKARRTTVRLIMPTPAPVEKDW